MTFQKPIQYKSSIVCIFFSSRFFNCNGTNRMIPLFHHPFTAIFTAPSNSGKSTLAYNIIKNSAELVNTPFDSVFVLYRSWQPLYDQMKRDFTIPIHFFERTFPEPLKTLLMEVQTPVILIDDGLDKENQRDVQDLFTRHSHHLGVSVILLTQSVFDSKDPTLRICHRNTKILIVFGCPRDQGSLRTLVYQMHPDRQKAQYLLKTMDENLQKPYSYIMMDFQPTCPFEHRYKTNILSEYPLVFSFPALRH